MNTITIPVPKNLTDAKNLVVISLEEYKEFLKIKNARKKTALVEPVKRTMRVPKKHEKFYDQVDKDLTEALEEVARGECYGPFETVEESMRSLKSAINDEKTIIHFPKKIKYEDFYFKSKHPKEKNLAQKIDEILY